MGKIGIAYGGKGIGISILALITIAALALYGSLKLVQDAK